jgi:hypothetical protein
VLTLVMLGRMTIGYGDFFVAALAGRLRRRRAREAAVPAT